MKLISIINFALLILVTLTISCKSKSITTDSQTSKEGVATKVMEIEEPVAIKIPDTKQIDQPKSDTPDLYSVVVSFYSIGAGIDVLVAREYDFFVRDFQEQHADFFYAERVPWGREGEIDYCIQFPALNKEKAREFMSKSNEILAKSKLVHLNENAECKRRRKTNN